MDVGTKRVSVAVRCRPILRNGVSHLHSQEKFELIAVNPIGDTGVQVQEQKQDEACRSSVFNFDHIFDSESTQLEVYEDAVVDLIDGALSGVNATILAYGQTGSGKTHTVLGEVKPNPLENDLLTAQSGMFLRVLSDLIDYKQRRADKMHVTIGLSCVEIYNENIRDLFGGDASQPPPQMKVVMTDDSVYMPSLIVKEVESLQSVFSEIQLAIGRRASRSTDSNAASSRSHCLFMIDLLQCPVSCPPPPLSLLNQQPSKNTKSRSGTVAGKSSSRSATPVASSPTDQGGFQGQTIKVPGQAEPIWASKILLADLAGSEKIRNSGVSGKGLEEATSINSSLTALGNVVHSLYEGGFVSYRVSKLTQLLKPAFSQSSSRVLLLAQVAPTQLTFDETISTLHFANKVKDMKVQTTTGTEVEKLQFDVVEAEKVYDALLADLHIWMAESECQPLIRKGGFVSGSFYDSDPERPYRAKERLNLLNEIGVLEAAKKHKETRLREKQEEADREVREKESRIKGEAKLLVDEHDEQVEDLQGEIADQAAERKQGWSQKVNLDCTSARLETELEADAIFLQLENDFLTQGLNIISTDLGISTAELEKLSKIKIETNPLDAELESQIEDEDEHYGCSVYAHCNAKRFFAKFMDMREAHSVLLQTKRLMHGLKTWTRKAALMVAEKEKKEKKHADPNSQAAAA